MKKYWIGIGLVAVVLMMGMHAEGALLVRKEFNTTGAASGYANDFTSRGTLI